MKKNNQVDILRIDNDYVNFDFLYGSDIVLNRNEVNLYYLPLSIFQYIFSKSNLSLKQIYLINIILSYGSKILIGHNIDNLIFKCKELFPDKTTMVYQHNIIYDSNITEYEKSYSGFKCDYFFVFDKRHKNIFSKIVDSKYIIVGSVKNNEIKLINSEKKYSIMYISEFRNNSIDNFRSVAQTYIVDCLLAYCKNINGKLCIAPTSKRPEKKHKLSLEDELKFFDQKNNKFFIEDVNSYELASKSELIICISSNLGIELVARKFKVLFLPILELYDANLRYPYFRNDNSPILFCGLDREIIFKKIDYLLGINDIAWKKIIKKDLYNFHFDENNTELKKYVAEHLGYN